ncbi:uncharacterized protein JCM6883_001840 [Sporobolomyces salmoneus]|uniref:uncharacterized protein n=1 Tax=Sporobolomyces salmoneus TaxID=183962 RepID=UPI00316FD027
MSSRLPQIHPSALSPQEWEAYEPIFSEFSLKASRSASSQVKDAWDYLVTWLDDDKAHKREAETEPVALSRPPLASPSSTTTTNNNPFLSKEWASRRSRLITPPSSFTSPTSSQSHPPQCKPLISNKTSSPSAFPLASPPTPTDTVPLSSNTEIPPRRPSLPPPRRSSNAATTKTQRSVSASTPTSSQSTILADAPTSQSSAPPLPFRRSVSLHHPSSTIQPLPSSQLSRASTVKASRPPPPVPPPKNAKPILSKSSSTNAHIGPEDGLNLHLAAGGGGSKTRSRSNSAASSPASPAKTSYTYAPIASSSSSSASTTQQHRTISSRFAGFSSGSIVLPFPSPSSSSEKPLDPLPPPSHPNRRKSAPHSSSMGPANLTTSRRGSDPFLDRLNISTNAISEAGSRVREVIGNMGGGTKGRRSSDRIREGEESFDRKEERAGLIEGEESNDDDPYRDEAGIGDDVETEEEEFGETHESESETEGEVGGQRVNGVRRERRKEIDREARRRDEQGQWVELA